jgi:hypothetical protein
MHPLGSKMLLMEPLVIACSAIIAESRVGVGNSRGNSQGNSQGNSPGNSPREWGGNDVRSSDADATRPDATKHVLHTHVMRGRHFQPIPDFTAKAPYSPSL